LVINNVLLPPFIAALLYGLATERTVLGRFLAFPVVELLGKSSYAFYLIHMGVIERFTHTLFPYITLPVRFALLNLIAITFFKIVEEPLNHAIRRQFGRRRQAAPPFAAVPASEPGSVP
jgi:peptidoglycan/LPS O-acetylase OafA/YrhL